VDVGLVQAIPRQRLSRTLALTFLFSASASNSRHRSRPMGESSASAHGKADLPCHRQPGSPCDPLLDSPVVLAESSAPRAVLLPFASSATIHTVSNNRNEANRAFAALPASSGKSARRHASVGPPGLSRIPRLISPRLPDGSPNPRNVQLWTAASIKTESRAFRANVQRPPRASRRRRTAGPEPPSRIATSALGGFRTSLGSGLAGCST
jgi:hypothetical protein